jgi:hypothetical protein
MSLLPYLKVSPKEKENEDPEGKGNFFGTRNVYCL